MSIRYIHYLKLAAIWDTSAQSQASFLVIIGWLCRNALRTSRTVSASGDFRRLQVVECSRLNDFNSLTEIDLLNFTIGNSAKGWWTMKKKPETFPSQTSPHPRFQWQWWHHRTWFPKPLGMRSPAGLRFFSPTENWAVNHGAPAKKGGIGDGSSYTSSYCVLGKKRDSVSLVRSHKAATSFNPCYLIQVQPQTLDINLNM